MPKLKHVCYNCVDPCTNWKGKNKNVLELGMVKMLRTLMVEGRCWEDGSRLVPYTALEHNSSGDSEGKGMQWKEEMAGILGQNPAQKTAEGKEGEVYQVGQTLTTPEFVLSQIQN